MISTPEGGGSNPSSGTTNDYEMTQIDSIIYMAGISDIAGLVCIAGIIAIVCIAAIRITRGIIRSRKNKERENQFYYIYNHKSTWHKRV